MKWTKRSKQHVMNYRMHFRKMGSTRNLLNLWRLRCLLNMLVCMWPLVQEVCTTGGICQEKILGCSTCFCVFLKQHHWQLVTSGANRRLGVMNPSNWPMVAGFCLHVTTSYQKMYFMMLVLPFRSIVAVLLFSWRSRIYKALLLRARNFLLALR